MAGGIRTCCGFLKLSRSAVFGNQITPSISPFHVFKPYIFQVCVLYLFRKREVTNTIVCLHLQNSERKCFSLEILFTEVVTFDNHFFQFFHIEYTFICFAFGYLSYKSHNGIKVKNSFACMYQYTGLLTGCAS